MRSLILLLLSVFACLGQGGFNYRSVGWIGSLTTTEPIGTNGVLWWTNNSGAATSIVDPVDVDLTGNDVYSIAARNCTNLQSLVGGNTTLSNFTFNGLTSLTNINITGCVLTEAVIDSILLLIVNHGASNATCRVGAPDPSATGITNYVILDERQYDLHIDNTAQHLSFSPINTTYTVNGVSKFVGQLWVMDPSTIYSVSKGSDVHNWIMPFDSTSITNGDFNGDNFNQSAVDNILTGINNCGTHDGSLDLQNTSAPTDGPFNGDYLSLIANGWTVDLTP